MKLRAIPGIYTSDMKLPPAIKFRPKVMKLRAIPGVHASDINHTSCNKVQAKGYEVESNTRCTCF